MDTGCDSTLVLREREDLTSLPRVVLDLAMHLQPI